MQFSFHRDSGVVVINGTAHHVDMTGVQPEIAGVRWYDDHGTLTYADGRMVGIGDVVRFKAIIDLWHAKQNAMVRR
ncbi:hypothetical protein [Bradyrhizobium sp. S3.7.6]